MSTGLMVQPSKEKDYLTGLTFDLVILDEAHKARARQGYGQNAGEPNELLTFLHAVANRADHVLLNTVTPIQTHNEGLWDLVLHRGSGGFVLGNDLAPWHNPARVLPILSGEERVLDLNYGWQLLRSPLPTMESSNEPNARRLFRNLREDLGLHPTEDLAGALPLLSADLRDDLESELLRVIDGASFFQRENPLVRHVVLRKRATLEARGLLDKIVVNLHPEAALVTDPHGFNALFEGIALRATPDFDRAYREARAFGQVLARRGKGGGFMKNLMEQRVCSSVVAGINTATPLLEGRQVREETEDAEVELELQGDAERAALEGLIAALEGIGDDPKLRAIRYYLRDDGWLELGCIIFSQYHDTARWVADSLAAELPGEIIGDEWIDDLETLGEKMDQYIEERRRATGFDLRYNDSIKPSDDAWRDCAAVLARRDLENLMRQGWGG